jgi:hypothetical protein
MNATLRKILCDSPYDDLAMSDDASLKSSVCERGGGKIFETIRPHRARTS